uniref:Uncharacterized protein n=1 Tax=Romanomermis culicivorax TaxID=13658 RepID=A0A915HEB5_ROMCU
MLSVRSQDCSRHHKLGKRKVLQIRYCSYSEQKPVHESQSFIPVSQFSIVWRRFLCLFAFSFFNLLIACGNNYFW